VSNRGAFNAIAFRDVLFNTIIGIMLCFSVALLLINVKAKLEDEAPEPPGNLSVMIVWPEGQTDVDLWLYGPGETRPVGFSRRQGLNWTLLRDDLGVVGDPFPGNFENAYARSIEPGRYVFNLMAYSGITYPQTVHFELSVLVNGRSRVLLTTTVTLVKKGQEITVVSIEIDKNGNVVAGSANNIFKPLFKAWG
jgi:hypothetical protein